jgi:putative tricarboxylic transport membrane protein
MKGKHLGDNETPKSLRLKESFSIMIKNKFEAIRGALIGTFVGILPGAGGSIASIVSYGEAKRSSKNKDNFGKGEPEGLIASETANNATVGGGFVPTLCLGIPGTPPDAVILGALLVQGIRTGDTLFTQQSSIVYTFIFGLALATIMMLPLGLLMGRYAYKSLLKVPKQVLIPIIIFLTIIGSYSIQNNILNVYFMFFFGLIGWVLNRAGFKASPIVLGLVLGQIAEQGFVQAYIIGNAQENIIANYFARPISFVLVLLIIVSLFMPAIKKIYKRRKGLVND